MAPPTLEEIKACKGYVSPHDKANEHPTGKNKLRIGQYMVKYGNNPGIAHETGNMRFVAQHCPSAPVPRVRACYEETYLLKGRFEGESPRTTIIYYLVSDFIEGKQLMEFMKELSDQPDVLDQAITQITGKLKSYMDDIRKIPSEGYIGNVGEKPSQDFLFGSIEDENNPEEIPYGPFYSQQDMAKTLVRRLKVDQDHSVMAWVEELTTTLLGDDHPIVFTHNDFCALNIMVQCVNGEYDVFIIDWEYSGFYPAYWEYSFAAIAGLYFIPWLPMVGKILQPYYAEHLVLHYIRYLNNHAPFQVTTNEHGHDSPDTTDRSRSLPASDESSPDDA